ncbi:YihY/virulence factor BrkB family protein [Sphingomonas aerophila]|uniref:Membrane protein n=1 Tax=Sphingomonas aerophila TaxID=1344948 RepID=A0A7W9BCY7_9SPHN|nr:YihY/virulence factor BrkB family protein [Sphingomonas aerophila]MBB5714955.1 membrane protein [Sphingomonas aerophila]
MTTISPKATSANAISPWQFDWPAWKAVLWRSWSEAGNDNVGLIAAGVAFYGFLAIVPVLGAIVLSYGLVATPETVVHNVQGLTKALPADAAQLVGEQLMNVVKTSDGKKGLGLLLALALALFGARNGAGAIITALNVAYEETEKRGFIKVNLIALAMTAAGVVAAVLAVVATAALAALEDLLPTSGTATVIAGKIGSYLLLLLAGSATAAALYQFGPSRSRAKWSWITPGSLLCSLAWLLLTLGFGIYVSNFGNYNATYGSLGAVVVLLTWLYLSSYILMLGAELNSECEHQTATDTTTGAPQPIGQRGAWVADHVAGCDDAAGTTAGNPRSAGLSDAPADAPIHHRPGAGVVAAFAGGRAGSAIGGKGVGLLNTGLATAGLALVRGRRRAPLGAAMLAAAGALAWVRGKPAKPKRAVKRK